MRKVLLLAAAAAMLATTPALAARTCVMHNDIRNFTALNDRTVVIENYRHQKVLLKLIGTCSDLKFHESLAIVARGESGLSCVQSGDTVVTRNSSGVNGRCAIASVTPYYGSMNTRDRHGNVNNGDDTGDRDDNSHANRDHGSY